MEMFVLEVMSGPLDGKTWSFDREITIGRDDTVAGACITIDRYISRKHARLYMEGEELRLTDLESRNGTRIDGRPVASPELLTVGQTFMVGRTTLRVTKA
jgi:pSer/pThr/pTyr-binding forkhead associated (FHA) protein